MHRRHDLREGISANRRRRALELALPGLSALLGRHIREHDLYRGADADAIVSDFWRSNRQVEHTQNELRRTWDAAEPQPVQDALARLATVLPDKTVTFLLTNCSLGLLSLGLHEVFRLGLRLAELNDHSLAAQDVESASRLCLIKHEYHYPTHIRSQWELEVWGEPWLSLSRAALG